MQSKVRWIALAIAILLISLVAWRFAQIFAGGGGPKQAGGRRGGAQKVAVARAAMDMLTYQLEVVGNVESSQNVDIVARTPGLLQEVLFREGDEVSKGDILARIDDSQARANLYKVRSDLATARFNYYELLSQQELTGVQAESSVSIAQANLSAARANLEKTQAVHSATVEQGQTSLVQAQANLVQARSQLRQAQVDFDQSKVQYERILDLQRQGFASAADAQNAYADVLSKAAAVDAQKAAAAVAEKEISNAEQQAKKDSVSTRADIETSRHSTAAAQATLNEARAGQSKTDTFQQQLKARQSLVEAAEANLQGAELQLAETVLRSPVDGFVSDRQLDPGAVTSVGSVIMTVQAGGEVWVVAALPQEIYRYVDKGEACTVTIDGLRGRRFDAHVFSKDAAVDTASRQFNIRVKLDDHDGLVKPGMFARVQLTLGPPGPRLVVPSSALFDKDSDARTGVVYTVEDGKVVRKPVEFGLANDRVTMIRSGLSEGELVVIQTAQTLREGQEVQTEEQPLPGSKTSGQTPSPPDDASGQSLQQPTNINRPTSSATPAAGGEGAGAAATPGAATGAGAGAAGAGGARTREAGAGATSAPGATPTAGTASATTPAASPAAAGPTEGR